MRKVFFGLVVVSALGLSWTSGAAAGGGMASGGSGTLPDPPLTKFTQLTLPGQFGNDVQAVLYDGNVALQPDTMMSTSTTMTGFTVPAPPFFARTTYVVADGQCGFAPEFPEANEISEPCIAGSPTFGSGDTMTFTGSMGSFTRGPDAFRGHDDCSYMPTGDTCLWDTRTEDADITPLIINPGDTSVSVTVAVDTDLSGETDCINHQAQAFAVGPTLAWLTSGYTSDGVGLRNRDKANVTIAGVPPGSQVLKAYLYWNILYPPLSTPSGAMMVDGVPIVGTMIGSDRDPCWFFDPTGFSYAFRADVTSIVPGNGLYTLSGYPSGGDATGSNLGFNPFIFGSRPPMAEGASLLVFYGLKSTPGKATGGGYIDPVTGELIDPGIIDITQGVGVGNKANFGFNVSFAATDTAPKGQLRYIDHASGEDIKATKMDFLVIRDGPCGLNTHADIYFRATENGVPNQPFKVEVDDCAEPGSQQPLSNSGPDMLKIQKFPAGYWAAGPLVGGNIQIHKT